MLGGILEGVLKGCGVALALCWLICPALALAAELPPGFDFRGATNTLGWEPTHDVSSLQATAEGLVIQISGSDPYITGPARNYPEGVDLWLRMRVKSDQGGTAQVFYFPEGQGPTEERSIRFNLRGGVWEDAQAPLPALGPRYRLRFDPPGTGGQCVVESMSFGTRVQLQAPPWPVPKPMLFRGKRLSVRSGDLELYHQPDSLGAFAFSADGRWMGCGHSQPLIGYQMEDGQTYWLDLAAAAQVTYAEGGNGFRLTAVAKDPQGAEWRVTQRFERGRRPGAIDIRTEVRVSEDRSVVYLPMLVLMPGLGSFGERKGQGLFAGLEYLENEPSSSEADIIGPGSKRQVPDTLRITFPLMAIQAGERYVGLIWNPAPHFSALFDSPDRQFASGAHVMGILFPGSNGVNRVEGSLLPYQGEVLKAGQAVTLEATLIGGVGRTVVPAVRQYVELKGLPELPKTGLTERQYAALAAGGWLDSKIREGERYRHAYWPGSPFEPHAAADVAAFMEWLRPRVPEAEAARLEEAARKALEQVGPSGYGAAVSHVHDPVVPLLFGRVEEHAALEEESGRANLGRLSPEGTVVFNAPSEGLDYARTHYARHANGLTAQAVVSALRSAVVSGDPELTRQALAALDGLAQYAEGVPRGAQTWEVPLHTPDILASAHLVRAYVYGYELTGRAEYLDQARYWAWTGVPFVYLHNPTDQPVGPYATIAVFGATQWVAPNWMGLPVQWCGLVYSDALYRLARHDPRGPWRKLAEGITLSGIQQSWTAEDGDLQGLLPDSYNLRPQTRNPVAINPGTVQANATHLYGDSRLYDYHVFRRSGTSVHAPGSLTDLQETPTGPAFTVKGWVGRPYWLLISGLKSAPTVRVNGQPVPLEEPHRYQPGEGRLVLQVEGSPRVEIAVGG